MQVCPNCGEENPDRFRLCGICGTKLAPDEVAGEVRKTVTVVFSDLKGSTTLGETLDTEALREVLNVYFNDMRSVLERHGGTVQKYIGDAIMAVFGLPKLHEDDALRAVRAAHEMQGALARLNDRLDERWGVRLHNRTGVYTGEVVAGDVSAGQHLVTGDAANTAARLEQNAPTDEILVGDTTIRLVKDAVQVEEVEPLPLKGKAEPVPAYKLLSVTGGEGVARRLDTPMVGREKELALLMEALDRAERERRAHVVTVFGPAGLGKSRLLIEFLAAAGQRVTELRGRCLSYGDGITFWPLREVIRQAAGIADGSPLEEARRLLYAMAGEEGQTAAERVAAAIGLSEATFPVQETFWGARQLLESLVGERPAVVFVDDIHWAEETFLELLQYLVAETRGPMVLVCSSRPELLEDHAEWIQETERVHRIVLEPLTPEESAQVAGNLLGATDLDESVRARVIEGAEGNPLFVEQFLSMLIDEGSLQRDAAGRWVLGGDLDSVTVPPTIAALLTARLDRLGATERATIERGAVVGQEFFRGAVEHLSPESLRPHVGPALHGLVRKELIRSGEPPFPGEEAFLFVHGLIRDSAYHGLLKRARAELHESFVEWSIEAAPDRGLEFEEIRGYHLEQAFLIRAQLGPLDAHGLEVGIRGAGYLAGAGERALARGDMPAASSLLQRAASLRPVGDPERGRLFLRAGEAMIETGEFDLADAALASAADEAARIGDEALEITARLAALQRRYETDPESAEADVVEEAERAIPVLEELGGNEGLARAYRLLTQVHWTRGRYGAAERSAQQMIDHAREAGDHLMEARVLPALAVCAVYGPTPVPDAIERCERILERTGNDRKAQALTRCALAHLEAMRGEFEQARELYRWSRTTFEELGWNLHAALTSIDSGPVEMLASDPVAAERELRRDYEELERMGEHNYISTTAGLLAEALYRQSRYEEAEALAGICREVAAEDDVASQSLWRTVLGKVLAQRGAIDEAVRLVGEGLELVRATDDVDALAHALKDLAEVLILGGRSEEGHTVLAEAVGRFEEKGNVVWARKARATLQELTSGGAHRAEPVAPASARPDTPAG